MKSAPKIFLATFGILLVVVIVLLAGLVTFFPNSGPLVHIVVKHSPDHVKRGAYLVNAVAGCPSCHSLRDESLFAMPLKPGTRGQGGEEFGHSRGFPGNFIAPNISIRPGEVF